MRARRIHARDMKGVILQLILLAALPACMTPGAYQAEEFAGRWEVELDSEYGPIEQTWIVDENLNGRIIHVLDGSTLDMFNVQVHRKDLSFEAIFAIGDDSIPARFVGIISEDALVGEFRTDLGNTTVRGLRR